MIRELIAEIRKLRPRPQKKTKTSVTKTAQVMISEAILPSVILDKDFVPNYFRTQNRKNQLDAEVISLIYFASVFSSHFFSLYAYKFSIALIRLNFFKPDRMFILRWCHWSIHQTKKAINPLYLLAKRSQSKQHQEQNVTNSGKKTKT